MAFGKGKNTQVGDDSETHTSDTQGLVDSDEEVVEVDQTFVASASEASRGRQKRKTSEEKDKKKTLIDEVTFNGADSMREHGGAAKNEVPQKLSLDELNKITKNFGTKSWIGEYLDYYHCFHGKLSNGEEVIIKKFDTCSFTDSESDFEEKLSMISRLKNEYLSQLFGYCLEKNNRILVYQYSTMSCLHDILHGRQGGGEPGLVLNWAQRVKFAYGAARGLEYLHEQVQPINCDVSSSNVLVSDDFESKIVYFSLSDLSWRGNLELHPRKLAQLESYHSPEYVMTGQVTQKSDVYSFGVVLLELLTGRKPVDHTMPSGKRRIVTWATPRLSEDKVKECVDPRLNDDYPPKAVAKFAAIAALCVQYEAEFRPSMSIVVRAIQRLLKPEEAASELALVSV